LNPAIRLLDYASSHHHLENQRLFSPCAAPELDFDTEAFLDDSPFMAGAAWARSAEQLSADPESPQVTSTTYSPRFAALEERELFLLTHNSEIQSIEDILNFLENCLRFQRSTDSLSERGLVRKMINFWSDFLRRRTGYLPILEASS